VLKNKNIGLLFEILLLGFIIHLQVYIVNMTSWTNMFLFIIAETLEHSLFLQTSKIFFFI